MPNEYDTIAERPPPEPAHPIEDDRVMICAGPGDGSASKLEALRDSQPQRYPDLFDESGLQAQDLTSTETRPQLGFEYTPPGTSFYLKDINYSGVRGSWEKERWERMKCLHHDSRIDYTGSNLTSTLSRLRDDYAYFEAIVQPLEMPKTWEDWAVRRAIRNDTRPFNGHYNGYIGAVLANAVLAISDDPEEFLRSEWFVQLKNIIDEIPATFEAERLVRLAFRQQ